MLTRRRFGLAGACLALLGTLGCSDTRDATNAGDAGIGAAGTPPANASPLTEQQEYEAQLKQEREEAKKRK